MMWYWHVYYMLFPLHDVNSDDVSPLFTDLPSLAPGGAWRVSLEGNLLSLVEGGATRPSSRPWEDVMVEWIQATVLPYSTDWVWSVATTPRPSSPCLFLSWRKTLLNLLQGRIRQGEDSSCRHKMSQPFLANSGHIVLNIYTFWDNHSFEPYRMMNLFIPSEHCSFFTAQHRVLLFCVAHQTPNVTAWLGVCWYGR